MVARIAMTALVAGFLFCRAAWAQPAAADPDWPCQQRLVPQLQAGSYWTGQSVPTGDYSWRDDPALTKLVQLVVDRDTPDADAQAALTGYLHDVPADHRATQAARMFGFIVGETNDERNEVVSRIEQLSRRQKNLSETIDGIGRQIDGIPETATGADAARRVDLTGQHDFNVRTFQEAQQTIRYACDVPATFDRRLGLFATTLQQAAK